MNVVIIPARGGSKRLPKKNIRDFNGKPIISYAIQTAIESKNVDKVYVSTDNQEIVDIALQYGAEVPFLRPKQLSDDFTTTSEVMAHAVKKILEIEIEIEFCCCLYPCTPLLRSKILDDSLDRLKGQNKKEFIFPIIKFNSSIYRALSLNDRNEIISLFPENDLVRTQDLKEAYFDSGQFYWGDKQAWLDKKSIHQNSLGIELSYLDVVDIDNQKDWDLAQNLYDLRLIK